MAQRKRNGEITSETESTKEVRIAGQPFTLRRRDVVRALRTVDPEPIGSHYVVVGTRRFPPKQVISAVTGLDRADFTTHQARRTLMRLGFSAGRRGGRTSSVTLPDDERKRSSRSVADSGELADQLRPLVGKWVAIKDDDVLHAADTARDLVGWLARHGQRADSMFRVPEDERAATGLAPL
jgi:hypothetical protein